MFVWTAGSDFCSDADFGLCSHTNKREIRDSNEPVGAVLALLDACAAAHNNQLQRCALFVVAHGVPPFSF